MVVSKALPVACKSANADQTMARSWLSSLAGRRLVEGDAMEAVVIGAGWAGLGVSYALADRGIDHIVFERARIGETWRTQRWDTFRLNTAAAETLMPGEVYGGA